MDVQAASSATSLTRGDAEDFEASRLSTFVETSAYNEAIEFIDDKDHSAVLICLDAPGTGKTATVAKAALDRRCIYVRLQCEKGILHDVIDSLPAMYEKVLGNKADGTVNNETASSVAENAWKVAMCTVFDGVTQHLKSQSEKSQTSFHVDRVDWDLHGAENVNERLKIAEETLRATVASVWSGAPLIVLHVDNIHSLIDTQEMNFAHRHMCMEVRTVADAMEYTYAWLVEALSKVCLSSLFKLCITGRCSPANVAIIQSCDRKYIVRLPYFGISHTKQLLRLALGSCDDVFLESIADRCMGNPACIHHVIAVLETRSTAEDVDAVINEAYQTWLRASGLSAHATTSAVTVTSHEALEAVMFPRRFGGYRHNGEPGGAPCAVFEHAKGTWMQAAQLGVIRLLVEDVRNVKVHPPHPFLDTFLRAADPTWKSLPAHDCSSLVQLAHANAPELSNNVVASIMALELCNPNNSLAAAIITAMQGESGKLLTHYHRKMRIQTFDTMLGLQELAQNEDCKHCIFLAVQTNPRGGVLPCDIAIPFPCKSDPLKRIIVLVNVATINQENATARPPHTADSVFNGILTASPSLKAMLNSIDVVKDRLNDFVAANAGGLSSRYPYSCFITNVSEKELLDSAEMNVIQRYNDAADGRSMGFLSLTASLLDTCVYDLSAAVRYLDYEGPTYELLFERLIRRSTGQIQSPRAASARTTPMGKDMSRSTGKRRHQQAPTQAVHTPSSIPAPVVLPLAKSVAHWELEEPDSNLAAEKHADGSAAPQLTVVTPVPSASKAKRSSALLETSRIPSAPAQPLDEAFQRAMEAKDAEIAALREQLASAERAHETLRSATLQRHDAMVNAAAKALEESHQLTRVYSTSSQHAEAYEAAIMHLNKQLDTATASPAAREDMRALQEKLTGELNQQRAHVAHALQEGLARIVAQCTVLQDITTQLREDLDG